jgi:hypothetical protein
VNQQDKYGKISHPMTSFHQHWLIVFFCQHFFKTFFGNHEKSLAANYRLASCYLIAGRASCKNMSSPAVSGASLVWPLAIVHPALEKT